MMPNDQLGSYFRKGADLRDRLAAIGEKVAEHDLVTCLLGGLPGGYDTVADILTMSVAKLKLDRHIEQAEGG